MLKTFHTLLAIAVLSGVMATPCVAKEADDEDAKKGMSGGMGVSLGGVIIGNQTAGFFRGAQFVSGVHFRSDFLTPYTECQIGILGRSQALSADQTNVFESSSLAGALGLKLGFLRAGLGAEAGLVRKIGIRPEAPTTVGFFSSPGLILEPYAGFQLPFLNTGVSSLDLTLHWPVVNWMHDSIGPRVMLTLWLGNLKKGAGDPEEEDEAEDEDDKGEDGVKSPPTPPKPIKPAPRPK